MTVNKLISIILCVLLVSGSFAACTAYKETPQPTGRAAELDTEAQSDVSIAVSGQAVSSTAAPNASTTAANGSTTAASTTKTAGVTVKQEGTVKSAGASTTAAKGKTNTARKASTTTTAPTPQYIDIVLLKNRKAKCSSPNVSLATGEVVIEKPGDYRITQNTKGDPWHGQITVKLKNTEKAELRFENVNIQNNTPNIIRILDASINTNRSFLETEGSVGSTVEDEIKEISDFDQAPNVQISFPEKTSSSFSSTANSKTGILYNESKLIIKGHGKASFKSDRNTNNCICSTKSMKIRNLSLSLSTSQNASSGTVDKMGGLRGIYSLSGVTLESGNLNIKTNGDAIRCDDFEAQGGTAVLTSSACDAIDADDSIVIKGGAITATALEKSSFKVRRVNNHDKRAGGDKTIKASDCIRSGKGDTFRINGGTVRGESKKVTRVVSGTQSVLTCKLVKQTKKSKEEEKVAAVVDIKGVKKSSHKCTKFLYSSSGLKKGKKYTASANGNSGSTTLKGIGTIEIVSSRKAKK